MAKDSKKGTNQYNNPGKKYEAEEFGIVRIFSMTLRDGKFLVSVNVDKTTTPTGGTTLKAFYYFGEKKDETKPFENMYELLDQGEKEFEVTSEGEELALEWAYAKMQKHVKEVEEIKGDE